MTCAAIIPARGGSKRIPRKNLRTVGGRTLVARAIEVAQAAGCVAWVSTEDDEIAAHAASLGAIVRARPIALASDTATTEAVITDWWRHLAIGERPSVIALLEPTSPLRSASDVTRCIDHVRAGWDAALTVAISHKLHFAGRLRTHDEGPRMWIPDRPSDDRPRTQTLPERAYEAGTYVFSATHWAMHGNRLAHYKRTAAVVVDEWRALDVDSVEELERADLIARARWEAA